MCEIMKKYTDQGRAEGRIDAIRNMIKFGVSKDQILTEYSVEDYEKACEREPVQE